MFFHYISDTVSACSFNVSGCGVDMFSHWIFRMQLPCLHVFHYFSEYHIHVFFIILRERSATADGTFECRTDQPNPMRHAERVLVNDKKKGLWANYA